MKTHGSLRYFLLALILSLSISFSLAMDRQIVLPVTDGVEHIQWQTDSTGVIRNISILKIDYNRPELTLTVETAKEKSHEGTTVMAKRANAIAAINGGYFDFGGSHVGLVYVKDKMIHDQTNNRSAVGFTPDHKVIIDRIDAKDGVIKGLNGTDWSKVEYALGGGPVLLQNGQLSAITTESGFGGGFRTTPHPRTAIGVTKDNTVYLVVVDGRQPGFATGMSLDDLGKFMRDQLGCTDALNLDGGGSSAMVINNALVNSVSTNAKNGLSGTERSVTNALALIQKEPVK